MEYKAKKIYKGHISIRDYVVKKAINKKEDLVIYFKDDTMTMTLPKLKHAISHFHSREFKSKYNNGQKYKLYDFPWLSDKDSAKIEEEKTKEYQMEIF